MNRLALALLLAALLPAGVHSQTATLVRDINPQPPAAGSPEASPRQLASAGARVVFITREQPAGEDPREPAPYLLWATDGSAAGTSTLLRLCSPCGAEPQRIAELPGLAVYGVIDTAGAFRLWRTDGTRAGTFAFSPPFTPGYLYGKAVFGRRLLFAACIADSQCALWSSDGSVAGTQPIQGAPTSGDLVVAGDRVYFQGYDGRGNGLWVTDGTAAGTKPVGPIPYGGLFTASGSRVFFFTYGDDYPEDLWTSDGTKEGTRFLRKFHQPNHYVPPVTDYLKAIPGGVLLVGDSGGSGTINLWRSDGTPAGTRQLTSFPDRTSVAGLQWSQIAVLGSRTFFVVTNATGPRLWSTGGTAATTAPVTGCPGGCPALQPYSPLIPAGGRIVFAARDLAHGAEPWTSDGTGPGTRLLRDLCAGACDSSPEAFVYHQGKIDFRATWNGRTRLARTDGISAQPLAPLPPDDDAPPYGSNYGIDFADLGARTVFVGFDAQGRQPWVTDGTAAGSRRIGSLGESGGSDPRDFVVLGDRLLFTASNGASDGAERSVWEVDPGGRAEPLPGTGPGASDLTVSGGLAYFVNDRGPDGVELWRTDGSPAGALRLAAFQNKALSDLRDVGGRLLFRVTSTDGEQPVFSFWGIDRGSDGTPAGVSPRFDLPADTVGISGVTALGPELYFVLDSETATQIVRSDGTAAGTRTLLRQSCDCLFFDDQTGFLRSGERVYFTAADNYGISLYQTDGTAAGTVLVLPAGSDAPAVPAYPRALFELQGDLYYFAANPDPESSVSWILWRGRTAAAATPLKTAGFQFYDLITPEYTVLNGRLYFRAWDPDHGFELWRTDGTAAGTTLVRDVAPGPTSSDPQGLVAAGGRLWFSALDPEHGRELWTSDGTRQGTRRVQDVAPGALSSAPEQLTPFGGKLFFSADDGAAGREPWSLPLE